MFKNHRLEVIKQIIEEKKYIEVSALSEILNVSEVTIRRDLNKLEEEGLVIRSFGGVSLKEAHADQKQQKISHSDINRDISNRDIPPKSTCMIGQIALQHIEDRDFIYIGSGKETKQLAVCLSESEKSVTVATNDMEIAQILSINRHIDTILTAGMISSNSTALKGELLLYTLERLVIKKLSFQLMGFLWNAALAQTLMICRGLFVFSVTICANSILCFNPTKPIRMPPTCCPPPNFLFT